MSYYPTVYADDRSVAVQFDRGPVYTLDEHGVLTESWTGAAVPALGQIVVLDPEEAHEERYAEERDEGRKDGYADAREELEDDLESAEADLKEAQQEITRLRALLTEEQERALDAYQRGFKAGRASGFRDRTAE